ncbi:hypothetical protein BJV82DRAFT_627891 [Fennellomyces sp. T-0311]|nr:hypothetical protein BJV82DRAFT_627891 [Fennellomyces sp. T-0311]
MLATDKVTKAQQGDLSSVFVHLGAKPPALEPRFIQLKREIAPADPSVLQAAYERVVAALRKESLEIRQLGSSIIPEISLDRIVENGGVLPDDIAAQVKRRGVLVVRNVIDESTAKQYKQQILDCIDAYRDTIVGFPAENPQAWELYWTKAQVAARSHPNFTKAALALNRLWHATPDTVVDLQHNLTYCDRLRIRQPGDIKFSLGGHLDGGSVERWECPEYRQCYQKIFDGQWEQHDPFDITHRIEAQMDMYDSPGGCSMFRIFQGWVSLSSIGPGGGTLRVCPLVKEPMAYILMKPLLSSYIQDSDLLGSWPGRCSDITSENHAEIMNDCMVSVPHVNFGDAVFWHCDQVHAVEAKNEAECDSSVLYIPSSPVCRRNSEYLKRQRAMFEKGWTPPDFPANNCEEHIEGFRATPETLNEDEKLGMGFKPLSSDKASTPGQKRAIHQHNQILAPFPTY